jgi:hydrogenase maturation protease
MIVLGLGSPYLTDDSVGLRVVRELAGRGGRPGIRFVESHAGGLLLLEELEGAERAVIVDALVDARRSVGEVVVAGVGETSQNLACSHDSSLPEALALGRALGMRLPEDAAIRLVAIVAADVLTFSETLTPQVEAALPDACSAVLACFATEPAFQEQRTT